MSLLNQIGLQRTHKSNKKLINSFNFIRNSKQSLMCDIMCMKRSYFGGGYVLRRIKKGI